MANYKKVPCERCGAGPFKGQRGLARHVQWAHRNVEDPGSKSLARLLLANTEREITGRMVISATREVYFLLKVVEPPAPRGVETPTDTEV